VEGGVFKRYCSDHRDLNIGVTFKFDHDKTALSAVFIIAYPTGSLSKYLTIRGLKGLVCGINIIVSSFFLDTQKG
jgi:hypothetical protein